jgi:hypothetical protein
MRATFIPGYQIPREVIYFIFQNLSNEDLAKAMLVNSFWRKLAQEDKLWKPRTQLLLSSHTKKIPLQKNEIALPMEFTSWYFYFTALQKCIAKEKEAHLLLEENSRILRAHAEFDRSTEEYLSSSLSSEGDMSFRLTRFTVLSTFLCVSGVSIGCATALTVTGETGLGEGILLGLCVGGGSLSLFAQVFTCIQNGYERCKVRRNNKIAEEVQNERSKLLAGK